MPQLIIPAVGGADRAGTGQYVARTGAGLVLTGTETTPAVLRDSLLRLLNDPGFREGADRLHQEWLDTPSPADRAAPGGTHRTAPHLAPHTRTDPLVNVLVLGGTGFLGLHVRRTLARGCSRCHGVPHVLHILRASDGLDGIEALVTVEERYRDRIGPVPDHARTIEPTPPNLLLRHCAAVVHHGGSGTAMTATSSGPPQLALPQPADQFAHGDRLAAAGAAISLDTAAGQDDPEVLAASLKTLPAEDGPRAGARELALRMTLMSSPTDVAAELGRLL
ncbi:hypothetical protein SUDANB6_05825 [Streptomyces sp. enrichment culture]|uniref:glycosyltransferase n=1 Tax=Streptomyces sp. enrichment culture TaxID=1795815 RepID=UPI003F578F16